MVAKLGCGMALLALVWTAAPEAHSGQPPAKRVQVQVADEKPAIFEAALPIDPVKLVQYQPQGNLGVRLTHQNRTLHLGYIYTFFHLDGQVHYPGQQGGFNPIAANQKLPKTPGGRDRDGYMATYNSGKLKMIQMVEVVPCKAPPGGKRRLDAVLVRITLENNDDRPHKVGMRVGMDTYIITNDGALFASPTTHPGKILDGVELKDKGVPDYLHALQNADLKNPGFVAVFTYALGNKLERPSRVVMTSLGAGAPDGYNVQAIQAMGDSAFHMFWDPRDIPAKGKREMAYALGGGIAISPEAEGNVKVDFGGSFELGKLFTIRAYVSDPAPGQSLYLELPPGLERLEGKEVQPVPAMDADGNSMVLWKARVHKLGQYAVRIRSTTGVTHTKILTISAN